MMKNEKAATMLKVLKTRKVARHNFRNGAQRKVALKPLMNTRRFSLRFARLSS